MCTYLAATVCFLDASRRTLPLLFLLCLSSLRIFLALICVQLFWVTFLSPTLVRINLLYASCFFTSGSKEEKLCLEHKRKDGSETHQSPGNEKNAPS